MSLAELMQNASLRGFLKSSNFASYDKMFPFFTFCCDILWRFNVNSTENTLISVALLLIRSFFQVAVFLRTVSVVTTEHGHPRMTSLLMANTVLSVVPAGLVETAGVSFFIFPISKRLNSM